MERNKQTQEPPEEVKVTDLTNVAVKDEREELENHLQGEAMGRQVMPLTEQVGGKMKSSALSMLNKRCLCDKSMSRQEEIPVLCRVHPREVRAFV